MNRLIRNIFQGQLNRGLMVKVMGALLLDRTTRKNITWSTDEYEGYGQGFTAEDEILVNLICGDRGAIIQPRLLKMQIRRENGPWNEQRFLHLFGSVICRIIL